MARGVNPRLSRSQGGIKLVKVTGGAVKVTGGHSGVD